MKEVAYSTLLVGFIILWAQCASSPSDPFANCRGGKPKAVFEGAYAAIDSQHFEIRGMEGIERVWFANGVELELIQAGCEKVRQIFQFELPGQFEETENWILLSASQFQFLSSISERHFELGMWGQAIQQHVGSLFLGEKIMLQPGFFIKIDKVRGTDKATLIVELSEE